MNSDATDKVIISLRGQAKFPRWLTKPGFNFCFVCPESVSKHKAEHLVAAALAVPWGCPLLLQLLNSSLVSLFQLMALVGAPAKATHLTGGSQLQGAFCEAFSPS